MLLFRDVVNSLMEINKVMRRKIIKYVFIFNSIQNIYALFLFFFQIFAAVGDVMNLVFDE